MARASTAPALAPTACTTRQPVICNAVPDSAQPTKPITNRARPTAIGPRRPWRSPTGPQSELPQAEADQVAPETVISI